MSFYQQIAAEADAKQAQELKVSEFWEKEIEPQIRGNLSLRYVEILFNMNPEMLNPCVKYAIREKYTVRPGKSDSHPCLILQW